MNPDSFKRVLSEKEVNTGTPHPLLPGMLLTEVKPTGALPDHQAA